MHHCLADFDFNLGNVNIHNRKPKAELCYTPMDIVGFFYVTNESFLYGTGPVTRWQIWEPRTAFSLDGSKCYILKVSWLPGQGQSSDVQWRLDLRKTWFFPLT